MGSPKLTPAEREMLRVATLDPEGCPWHRIGIRSRAGKVRMFDAMKARGLFGAGNCITPAGRAALAAQEKADG